jgi:methylmalonyl-CoA decarboxylase
VARTDEFEPAVETLARQIATSAPLAVQGMKQILRLVERNTALSEAEILQILELRQQSYDSEDFREGRAAFEERREPRFRGG